MIADKALGYFGNSHRGRKPILSGLHGTWRAIKQPDIFLVNHQQRGNFLRVQLTTSRSDFSGELLRRGKSWGIHSYTLSHMPSPALLPSCPPLHTRIHFLTPLSPSLLLLLPPSHLLPPCLQYGRYSLTTGDTISSPVVEQGWKLVAGVSRMRVMDLYLKAIMVLCTEMVTIGIPVKAPQAYTCLCPMVSMRGSRETWCVKS